MDVRYPDIEMMLRDSEQNPFLIISDTEKALRKAGVDEAIIAEYTTEAKSGNFDDLIETTMRWVTVW